MSYDTIRLSSLGLICDLHFKMRMDIYGLANHNYSYISVITDASIVNKIKFEIEAILYFIKDLEKTRNLKVALLQNKLPLYSFISIKICK